MRVVTKAEFKEMYFRFGKMRDGHDKAYWDRFYEKESEMQMTYKALEPQSDKHTRMMIVTDFGKHGKREHRLFFLTEIEEEQMYDNPGKGK